MAPRGRPPKPKARRDREGNRRRRTDARVTPEMRAPLPEELSAPSWLDAGAKAIWKEFVPELQKSGVLAIVDKPALAIACQAYSDTVDARKKLKKLSAGTKAWWRETQRAQHAVKIYKSFATEFGLTASSRMRLDLAPDTGDDESDLDEM
jgi:P27 family predicted phage terminase small subunit